MRTEKYPRIPRNFVGGGRKLRDMTTSMDATVTHVVRIHYDEATETITPDNWIVIVKTSQRLNIVNALDLDNLHRYIELECTEKVT